MASWVVSDSGILLASVLKETYSAQAKALLKQWHTDKVQIAAPALLKYELVAVQRKHMNT